MNGHRCLLQTIRSAALAAAGVFFLTFFGHVIVADAQSAAAPNYASPLPASCIRKFWDANNYNWLSFQNTCPQAVHVGFIAASPDDTFGMGAKNLAPGQADSTGWSQSDVNRKGGFVLFVCPAGYVAVDSATDRPIRRADEKFRCKAIVGSRASRTPAYAVSSLTDQHPGGANCATQTSDVSAYIPLCKSSTARQRHTELCCQDSSRRSRS